MKRLLWISIHALSKVVEQGREKDLKIGEAHFVRGGIFPRLLGLQCVPPYKLDLAVWGTLHILFCQRAETIDKRNEKFKY